MEGLSLCAAVYGILRPWTNAYRFRRQSLWQDILQTCRVTTACPFAGAHSAMTMRWEAAVDLKVMCRAVFAGLGVAQRFAGFFKTFLDTFAW